ncbi:hypothetical protein, partial [Jiella pacifica]
MIDSMSSAAIVGAGIAWGIPLFGLRPVDDAFFRVEQFVVGEGLFAGGRKSLTQPVAMTVVVAWGLFRVAGRGHPRRSAGALVEAGQAVLACTAG